MKKIILVIIFTLSLATLVSAQTAKPNIVFIITDDQRADTLDYMPKTMQLLAAQGILFNNSFASFPLCCPSRASFLTGLHVHNHKIWTNVNGGPMFKSKSLDTSTIATWLQNDGYRTGLIGKYLNDYEKTIPWPYMPPGWSDWDANRWPGPHLPIVGPIIKGDTSSIPSAKAVGFIKSTPPGQLFFLYLGLTAPHAPASSPKSDFALFANISPWNPPSYNETNISDKPLAIRSKPPLTAADDAKIQLFRKKQLASLQGVDRAVEKIVKTLEEENRINNTIIILTSDHGYFWGEHRLFGKGNLYEESSKIPLIIRVPNVAPRVENNLVENIDLAPTIADFAGVIPASKVNGISIKALILDSTAPWRDAILLETGANIKAVRTSKYFYGEIKKEKELYDLEQDPYQLNNVANDASYALIIPGLQAKLNALKIE